MQTAVDKITAIKVHKLGWPELTDDSEHFRPFSEAFDVWRK
jgi:hypothetical protein